MPYIRENVRNGTTSIDVDVLNFEEEINAIRVELLLDIATNLLASDVVRTISNFWTQNTASVGAEDNMFGSMHIVMKLVSTVVVESIEFFQCSEVTLELLRSSSDAALLTKLSDDLGATGSRTSRQLKMFAAPATSIDRASNPGSKSLAGLDLSLDGMVIVMLSRVGKRRSKKRCCSNSADEFGELNHGDARFRVVVVGCRKERTEQWNGYNSTNLYGLTSIDLP